jgi:sodium transport system permease protein
MFNRILIIAGKEIAEGWRDVRGLSSALVYALMGPAVVGMVSIALRGKEPSGAVLIGMMSVFTLVAAFVGGTSVAMEVMAGERERRSLLPLLLNPVSRLEVIAGKWLAVSFFSTAGLLVNLAGFALMFSLAGMRTHGDPWSLLLALAGGLLPLALLAGALAVAISTVCRTLKEAHTYLSMLAFLPMGLGLFAVFFPQAGYWWRLLPVAGQQWQVETWTRGGSIPFTGTLLLALATAAAAAVILWAAAKRLESDDVVYGR